MLLHDVPCGEQQVQRLGSTRGGEPGDWKFGAGALMWGWGKALLEQDGTREAHQVHRVEGLPSLLKDLHSIWKSLWGRRGMSRRK